MEVAAVILWLMFLVTTTTTNAEDLDELGHTTASTETNTVNTIDVLQNQLHQMLVQFCASEIDRNKTASAILKFGQLSNAKTSIKDVVQFYTENYEETFDNLLLFIDHVSSLELQQIAYNSLIEAINSKQISVINLLSFENFIRTKFDLTYEENLIEPKMYGEILSTTANHIKEFIVSTDLNRVISFINNSSNPDRIFELIPTIVQGIDLNNFTDMNRFFAFSMQLPKENQVKLISKMLSEMQEKTQYRHVFHVICQIKLLRNSIYQEGWTTRSICLLSALEQKLPVELWELLENARLWQIKSVSGSFLISMDSPKYSKTILFVDSLKSNHSYYIFESHNYNSVKIRSFDSYNYYDLTVEYSFHNESFPTIKGRDNDDLTQSNWYLLFSDDLSCVQIKNIFTNELLIADDIWDVAQDLASRPRVALTSNCSECDSSKWILETESGLYLDNYSRYSCGYIRVL